MSDRKGLKYEMFQSIKKRKYPNSTKKSYKKHAKYFSEFINEKGYTANMVRKEPKKYIQEYTDHLIDEEYPPTTIHTYISFICTFFRIDMEEILKPKRETHLITKSRDNDTNKQGDREENKEEFRRVVEFARVTGIRRSELKNLRGFNLVKDESGYLCIEIMKGKGGKYQLQRVLPKDEEFVKSYFDGSTDRVFTAKEMNNKIDFHQMRNEHAREVYYHFLEEFKDPAKREKAKKELHDRFILYNVAYNNKSKTPAEKRNILRKFLKGMNGTYKLRDNVKNMALEKGMPVEYDRTAIKMVSVFFLSHWRNDVTVLNYLLAGK